MTAPSMLVGRTIPSQNIYTFDPGESILSSAQNFPSAERLRRGPVEPGR
jgi:hypothetical protein